MTKNEFYKEFERIALELGMKKETEHYFIFEDVEYYGLSFDIEAPKEQEYDDTYFIDVGFWKDGRWCFERSTELIANSDLIKEHIKQILKSYEDMKDYIYAFID